MTASAQQDSAEDADDKTTVDDASLPKSDVGATAAGNGEAPAEDGGDENDGEWGEGRLSVDDADRFAAQFRPSWESMDTGGWGASPDAPSDTAAGQEASAAPAPAVAPTAPVVDEEPTAPAPQRAMPEAAPVVIAPVPTAPNPSAFDAVPDPVAIPASSNRNVFAALAVAGVLLVVVVGAVIASGGDEGEPEAEAASPPSESEAQPQPTAVEAAEASEALASGAGAPTPEPEAAPQITVAIRTQPEGAQLTLDGRRIDNPYEASLEPSGTHIVSATAEGFEGRREEVRFTENVDLTLALEALVPQAAPTPPPTMAVAQAATMRRAPRMSMRRPPAMRRGGAMMGSRMGFTTANPY